MLDSLDAGNAQFVSKFFVVVISKAIQVAAETILRARTKRNYGFKLSTDKCRSTLDSRQVTHQRCGLNAYMVNCEARLFVQDQSV